MQRKSNVTGGESLKTLSTPSTVVSPKRKSRLHRDRKAEDASATVKLATIVGEIKAARYDGTLGDDYIKLAQILILCSLPHSRTDKLRVTRTARLGDGSRLTVSFSAMREGVVLPYGRDRKLLAWIFDRAIRANSPVVMWSAANEYLKEMGIQEGGKANKELRERLSRIAGLGVVISRDKPGSRTDEAFGYKVLSHTRLPKSLTSKSSNQQQTLPGMNEDHMGIRLSAELFDDISRYNQVLPRLMWQMLTGPSQVQDIALWLCVRSYAAATSSLIPWVDIQEQFGSEDSNTRRIKVHARTAVRLVSEIWPEAHITVEPDGIRVVKVLTPLLPDDPVKKRIRMLT